MTPEDHLALTKYLSMEDIMRFRYKFNHRAVMDELQKYPRDIWPRYNPRKPIERYCLDLTQVPGLTDNVSSLNEYNIANNKKYRNKDFNQPTEIYDNLPTLKNILEPFRPWLGRTHVIRIDAGGYFPPHYDTVTGNDNEYDIRLVAAINNTQKQNFKWLYDFDDKVLNLELGELYIINTGKPHSVFSFVNDAIIMVANLNFDRYLFDEILKKHYFYD